ncbi:hypothetical protein ONZ45_g12438 [Pleurotus djamor]|nr:hypothetical protein ONZ45_g12438 [Pleurotus djamor]
MSPLSTLALSASTCIFALLSASATVVESQIHDPICVQIAHTISSASDVYYFGDAKYTQGIEHWASSSTQMSKCVVEPGSAIDVGIILGIVGSTGTPFAVKGGGHTSNPGFSSTSGVHISMTRFNEVTYDPDTQTVVLGAGLIWDDVYDQLDRFGVNVVGGRVSGVGIAGFILGGGYSWKTNQYGLTVDTVTAFELVKPSGCIANVTHDSDPQLFFGLKGGFNNFLNPVDRGRFCPLSLEDITPNVLEAMANETKFWGPRLEALDSAVLSYSIDPFLPSILTHNLPGQVSAYPPSRRKAFLPGDIYFSWFSPTSDASMVQAAKQSAQQLAKIATAEGQGLVLNAPKYPNYAITGTPLEEMYGANVPKLRALKILVDPTNVMGLAGVWKF